MFSKNHELMSITNINQANKILLLVKNQLEMYEVTKAKSPDMNDSIYQLNMTLSEINAIYFNTKIK